MHYRTNRHLIGYAAIVATTLSFPAWTHAGEINYGSVQNQRGDTLVVEYKGPAGAQFFTCNALSGSCTRTGTTSPSVFPPIANVTDYVHSADGTLAVKTFTFGTKAFYILYDIRGTKPVQVASLPQSTPGATVSFAKNGNAVLFKNERTYTRYDIATKRVDTLTLASDLSFITISPSASYITGYNYGSAVHELWRFSDGKKLTSPSSMQSYLEFSEDESRLAFLDDVGGFKTLYTMKSGDLGSASPASLIALTKPNTETEDFIFVGNTLYFLANVNGPLAWDLWSYDGSNTSLVDTNVSYGDFLKRIRTSKGSRLAYLKTTGKNTDIVLLTPSAKTHTLIAPVAASPASTAITRDIKAYGGRTGVLLAPKKIRGAPNVFIWMHGGPQRQVAVGHHPYLSYAVYDELLERLAAGGNYVYKIDYTGSTGYGAAFRNALDMHMGDVEIKDIRNAISAIRKDKKIGKVYLIGNSYGGYMAFRGMVDMPEQLDGVISINGVSDWYGLIEQIPSSPFRELFNGVPDLSNLDTYKKASVFVGMKDLTKTKKVLVVWGEQDSTVPTWQSTKYVDFAKENGVNISSLSFPDEEHIIRGRKNLDALCTKVTSTMGIKGVSCSVK